jgi:hypothetical protein
MQYYVEYLGMPFWNILCSIYCTGVSTFASRTSPNTKQSLQKSFHLSNPRKIKLKKIPPLLKIKKYAIAQPDTTKTLKCSNDNGLQGQRTEGLPLTAVLQKRGCRASIDSFFV